MANPPDAPNVAEAIALMQRAPAPGPRGAPAEYGVGAAEPGSPRAFVRCYGALDPRLG